MIGYMQNRKSHDVIIVGAGPAGALLGYLLAQQQFQVLLIEKKKFPRYKPCGGGLTRRALALLPFDISQIVEDVTTRASLFLSNRILLETTYPDPIITMVMRDKFDAFLMDRALQAGVAFMDETEFRDADRTDGIVRVITTNVTFETRVLVGADGVNSRVARILGHRVASRKMTALEGEVYFSDPDILKKFKGSVHFDFGVIPAGYGWIFPKGDHLSTGVLTLRKKIKDMQGYYTSYLERKGFRSGYKIKSLRGHLIPYGTGRKNNLAGPCSLLVGDAAGLSDPITGEGIYYALREAQIAAQVISGFFKKDYPSLERYNHKMRAEFTRDMVCAGRMSAFLYRFPRLSHGILKNRGSDLLKRYLKVVSGNSTYSQLYSLTRIFNEILGLKSGRRNIARFK